MQSLGCAWECIPRKCLAEKPADLLLGARSSVGCLSQPPPLNRRLRVGGTQIPPVPAGRCWLGAFRKVPRLTGMWLAF